MVVVTNKRGAVVTRDPQTPLTPLDPTRPFQPGKSVVGNGSLYLSSAHITTQTISTVIESSPGATTVSAGRVDIANGESCSQLVLSDGSIYNFENLPTSATSGSFLDQSGNGNDLLITNPYLGMVATSPDCPVSANKDGYSGALDIPGQHVFSGTVTHGIRQYATGDYWEGTFVLHETPATDPHTVFAWSAAGGGFGINTSLEVCTTNNGDQATGQTVQVGVPVTVKLLKLDNSLNDGVWEVFIDGASAGTMSYLSRSVIFDTFHHDRNDSTGAPFTHYSWRYWSAADQRFIFDFDYDKSLTDPNGWTYELNGAVWPFTIPADLSTGTPPTKDVFGSDRARPGQMDGSYLLEGGSQLVGNGSMHAVAKDVWLDGITGWTCVVEFSLDDATGGVVNGYRPNALWFDIGPDSGSFRLFLGNTDVIYAQSDLVDIAPAIKHRAVFVYDGSQPVANDRASIWLDGVKLNLGNIGTFPTSIDASGFDFRIARSSPSAYNLASKQKRLINYNRVLTDEEIRGLEADTVPSDFRTDYTFSEGGGNIIHDRSSNKLNAIIQNPYAGMWGTVPSGEPANAATQTVGCRWQAESDGSTTEVDTKWIAPSTGRLELKCTPAAVASNQCIVGSYEASGTKSFYIRINGTAFEARLGTAAVSIGTAVSGVESSIILEWNETEFTLTVDGQASAPTAVAGDLPVSQSVSLFMLGGGSTEYFPGTIRDVKAWSNEAGTGDPILDIPLNDGEDARWRARSYNGVDQGHATEPLQSITNDFCVCAWFDYQDPSAKVILGQDNVATGSRVWSRDVSRWWIWAEDNTHNYFYLPVGSGPRFETLGLENGSYFAIDRNGNKTSRSFTGGTPKSMVYPIEIGFRSSLYSPSYAQCFIGAFWLCDLSKATADADTIDAAFRNNGFGIVRGELTDQQRQDFGIVIENYGDDSSGDRYSVTGPNMTATGAPGSVDGPRKSVLKNLAGQPASISGTIEWATVADSNGIPPASGNDAYIRDRLVANCQGEAAGALDWGAGQTDLTLFDTSGNGHDARPTRGITSISDLRVAGENPFGTGFILDCASATKTYQSDTVLPSWPYTVLFAAYGAGVSNANICSWGDSNRVLIYYELSSMRINTAAGSNVTFSGVPITANVWNFGAVIIRNSDATIDINGTAETAALNSDEPATSLQPFRVGGEFSNTQFAGYPIGAIVVLDREATAQEIINWQQSQIVPGNALARYLVDIESYGISVDPWPVARPFADSLTNGEGINGANRSRIETCGADTMNDIKRFAGELTASEYSQQLDS